MRQIEKLKLTLAQIWGVLDEEWLYDLLPGDGQDDYILDQLRRRFMEIAKAEHSPASLPERFATTEED